MRAEDFERLYAEHAQPLFGFLVYRTGDRALAEDLLADTFERLLTARRGFDRRKGSEKTWLYTIALNLLRDHARRGAAGQRALERVAAGHVDAPPPTGFDLAMTFLGSFAMDSISRLGMRYGLGLEPAAVWRSAPNSLACD